MHHPQTRYLDARVEIIGEVATTTPDEMIARQRRTLVSEIVISPAHAPALHGIEEYSQLIVLFWMHRAQRGAAPLMHPRGNPALPLTGVLAARGRAHPNPIGLAVVDLLERRENILVVRRLDAYHGTPVIDVKPYDDYDVHPEPRVPAWFRALDKT